jgi:hypothetical protein
MADKHNAHQGKRRAAGVVNGWRSAITAHHSIAPTSIRQHLNALADKAAHLAETDPNVDRRARHKKLLHYLARRIARAILHEVGRR